jgi:hypothetical protein
MGERAPGIEGRFARKHLDSEYLDISYLRYSPASAHLRRIATANQGQPHPDQVASRLWRLARLEIAQAKYLCSSGCAGRVGVSRSRVRTRRARHEVG